jgi:hypothetical protein
MRASISFLASVFIALLLGSAPQSAAIEPQRQDQVSIGQKAKFEPDEKFLNSVVVVRQGVADFGEMKVKDFVQMVLAVGRPDATPSNIVGWSKDGYTYTLEVDTGEPIKLEFDFNGVSSQLQPIKTKRGVVDPWTFTMQLMDNLKVAAAKEAQNLTERILAEIKSLDSQQQEQLALLERDVDKGLEILKADIQALKQEQTKVDIRQKELRERIGSVLCERVDIQLNYEEKIRALQIAREEFERFKKDTLAAAAKLINEAILAKNLDVELVDRDGENHRLKFGDAENPSGGLVVDYSLSVFANMPEGYVWRFMISRNNTQEVNEASLMKTEVGQRYFLHFPRQIRDESVKKAFLKLYEDFDDRIRKDCNSSIRSENIYNLQYKSDESQLQNERDSALRRFDDKREYQQEGYRRLLSRFQNEVDELCRLRLQQAEIVTMIARKELVVNTPKENLPAALRSEIVLSFVEKRHAFESTLRQLSAR